jgi:hypothetical protein
MADGACAGFASLGEGITIAGVEVTFAGQSVGQQNIVPIEFDMVVGYFLCFPHAIVAAFVK